MSSLEQPFVDAIAAREIEGVIFEGRSKSRGTYSSVIGNRTLPDGCEKPLNSHDILFLASATKVLTAIAVLQCCEKGLLDLDKDLRAELPELVDLGVLVGFDDSPIFETLRKPLTLRHLLTHSSGLQYDFPPAASDPSLRRWREINPQPKPALDVLRRYTQPLIFQPGEGWEYGPGLDWAGYLVETASGLTLDEFVRTHILSPLSIPASEFAFFPVKEGLGERMPDLNPKDPKGEGLMASMGMNVTGGDDITGCFGGQGGYATSQAYIRILQSVLLNDGRLLSSDSVAEMFKRQLESAAQQSLKASLEGPMGMMLSNGTSGKDCSYGLSGLLTGVHGDGGLGKGTLCWGGGINTAWMIDPTNGLCGFASLQCGLPVNIPKAQQLKAIFRRELKDQLSTETTAL